MALAKAFALGPKPKRSLLFVWHSGEEAGLYGSRYNADFPIVPIDKISAQLNIDMIGRNRCDDPKEENTVYIVGSDRISTELHNMNEDANVGLPTPMKLDYEMNDPADPESIYTRSDHYSYAAKGIPIIFYTTGLHKDYHYLTDEVSKIDFPEDGAHHAAGLRDRHEGRQPRARSGARQQGAAEGQGRHGEDREQVKKLKVKKLEAGDQKKGRCSCPLPPALSRLANTNRIANCESRTVELLLHELRTNGAAWVQCRVHVEVVAIGVGDNLVGERCIQRRFANVWLVNVPSVQRDRRSRRSGRCR